MDQIDNIYYQPYIFQNIFLQNRLENPPDIHTIDDKDC